MNMTTSPTKFAHIRTPSHTSTIAFRYRTSTLTETEYVDYSVAHCNPRDRFVKKLGRDIAEGRMLKNIKTKSVEVAQIGSGKYADVVDYIKTVERLER